MTSTTLKKMNLIKQRLEKGFESATANTKEFLSFATKFKNRVTAILKSKGCSDITFKNGHFDINFRFKQDNGQTWFGALTDVRCRPVIYIRRTSSHADNRGDCNVNINNIADFADKLEETFNFYKNKPLYL